MSHHGGDRSSKAPAGAWLTVLSGCSGGGKSTLLEALADRGVATVAEYEHLLATYSSLGYATVIVPRLPVAARIVFVMGRLGITGS